MQDASFELGICSSIKHYCRNALGMAIKTRIFDKSKQDLIEQRRIIHRIHFLLANFKLHVRDVDEIELAILLCVASLHGFYTQLPECGRDWIRGLVRDLTTSETLA